MRRRTFLAVAGAGAVSGCLAHYAPEFVGHEFQDLDVSVEKLFPAHRYYFHLTGTDADPAAVGKVPIAYTDLDPEIRAVIRQTRDPGPVGFDNPPPELLATADEALITCLEWCSGSAEYAELSYLERDPAAPPLAELAAEVTEDGTGLEVTLTNTDDEPIVVFSGAGPPFGALKAVGIDGTDHVIELWSDSFRNAGVRIRDRRLHYTDVGVTTEFIPGETATRTYELTRRLTDEFVAGRYVLSPRSDASAFVYGEKTDIPFPVRYDRPDDHREKEIVDVRVTVDLV